jgi:hypothetical protein
LTKDNVAKKNWKGSLKCSSCNGNESIQHLFLDYPLSKMIWRIILFATSLPQPRSISHMFGNWLTNQNKRIRNLILTTRVSDIDFTVTGFVLVPVTKVLCGPRETVIFT